MLYSGTKPPRSPTSLLSPFFLHLSPRLVLLKCLVEAQAASVE